MKSSTNYEPILKKPEYTLLICSGQKSIKFRLESKTNPIQMRIYEVEIKSLAEMGKLQDYCESFAEVRECLKDPSNISVNTKDATLTISTKNPMKNDKLIELAVIKLIPLQTVQKSNIQKRIQSLEHGLDQIRALLKNPKHETMPALLSQFATKKELTDQIGKLKIQLKKGAEEQSFMDAPSFMEKQHQYSSIETSMSFLEPKDVRGSFAQSAIGSNDLQQSIKAQIAEVNKKLGKEIQNLNLQIQLLKVGKVDRKDLNDLKVNILQKYFEKDALEKGQQNEKTEKIAETKSANKIRIRQVQKFNQKSANKEPQIIVPQKTQTVEIPKNFTKKPAAQISETKKDSDWTEKEAKDYIAKLSNAQSWESLQKNPSLFLSNKQIVKLPDALCQLKNTTSLVLSSNKIATLPENFGNLHQLQNLQITKNLLSDLPNSITNLRSLKLLCISNNNFSKLPVTIFKLTKLNNLFIQSNKIEQIPEEIGSLVNLSKLSVRDNKLTKLPSSLATLGKLDSLWIGENKIRFLPDNFGDLKSLKLLNMGWLDLQSLPKSFGNLKQLNQFTLHLSGSSKISLLGLPLDQLTSLQKLRINSYRFQKSAKEEQKKFEKLCEERKLELKWTC